MSITVRLLAFTLFFAALLPAQLKLPAYSRRVLPNGVTVYVMRRPGVPLVDIDIAIKGGKESEPATLPGLAEITADLLRKGTASHTAASFSEALDLLGGSYRATADEQMTLLETEFLAKDLREGLPLVADTVLHPTFPNEELVKLLSEERDDIKSLKDNPAQAIAPYAHTYFFGKSHPYGRIIDEESVSRITRPDIENYYKQMYVGKNLIVAIVGDVDPDQASKEVERVFAQVPAGEPYRWKVLSTLQYPSVDRLLLIDKPGSTQTYFYIMQPGIDASNADRVAIRVVNTLFGGRFTSMLNQELRVRTGLTYGVHSTVEMDRLQGMDAIETFTKTDSTEKALELSLATLKTLRTNGITAEQLASAKAYLKGTLPRALLETSDELARELIRLDVLGRDRSEIDDLFQQIDAVTLDQANAVARKYFHTDGLTFVLVGDAAKIRSQLAAFPAKTREVEIARPGFGYSGN